MQMVIFYNNVKLLVNGKNYKTIFQISNMLGKSIPHFCYNKKLAIAGNCRICLVEVKGLPKPLASCATPISENIHIFTKTPLVLKSRENIMEFLLINHPLDCPVCDQGGECDLQDLSLTQGKDITRFYLSKRAVPDKTLNLLIKTKMTRCIHCTKCIRLSFFVGVNTLGIIYRGENSQIYNYNFVKNKNYLSANIIDICPVCKKAPKSKRPTDPNEYFIYAIGIIIGKIIHEFNKWWNGKNKK
jgi:NADH-quinone oxidoreductase subunit G